MVTGWSLCPEEHPMSKKGEALLLKASQGKLVEVKELLKSGFFSSGADVNYQDKVRLFTCVSACSCVGSCMPSSRGSLH